MNGTDPAKLTLLEENISFFDMKRTVLCGDEKNVLVITVKRDWSETMPLNHVKNTTYASVKK